MSGLTLYSLYAAAFVGIGLWFALANFAQAFNWLHFHLAYGAQRLQDGNPGSLYDLSQPVLTFLAGVALVVSAPALARRLARNAGPRA